MVYTGLSVLIYDFPTDIHNVDKEMIESRKIGLEP